MFYIQFLESFCLMKLVLLSFCTKQLRAEERFYWNVTCIILSIYRSQANGVLYMYGLPGKSTCISRNKQGQINLALSRNPCPILYDPPVIFYQGGRFQDHQNCQWVARRCWAQVIACLNLVHMVCWHLAVIYVSKIFVSDFFDFTVGQCWLCSEQCKFYTFRMGMAIAKKH